MFSCKYPAALLTDALTKGSASNDSWAVSFLHNCRGVGLKGFDSFLNQPASEKVRTTGSYFHYLRSDSCVFSGER